KNFQWGLRKSTLNHLMCMPFTDVAQVSNATRNYEILHERDDDDAERLDKRQKSGDRHQPTTQQSSHRNHGHNNDRHGSDRDLPLQFDDKIRAINAHPLDMCEFDIILGKSMQIIFALQAHTLLSHGCEGFLVTIHDTTFDVPSIHDQPIVSEFPDVFPDELP
nr:hypothetical protein [Tanacetum cinerariifolium]